MARDLVAEADSVVIHAEHDGHPPLVPILLAEADRQLVVAVADRAILAPRLLPSFVDASCRLFGQGKIAQHLGRVGEQEAEPAFRDDRLPLAADRIADASFWIERDINLQRPRRRACAGDRLVGRRSLSDRLSGGGDGDKAKDESGG